MDPIQLGLPFERGWTVVLPGHVMAIDWALDALVFVRSRRTAYRRAAQCAPWIKPTIVPARRDVFGVVTAYLQGARIVARYER